VPKEVSIQLDDYSHKRAQVFSQLAAALADTHPDVREFRKRFLGSENIRLTEEHASEFLYEEHSSERQRITSLLSAFLLATTWVINRDRF